MEMGKSTDVSSGECVLSLTSSAATSSRQRHLCPHHPPNSLDGDKENQKSSIHWACG